MDVVVLIAAGLGGLVAGILVGLKLGTWLQTRPRYKYWLWNLAVLFVGVTIVVVGNALEAFWVEVFALAVMGGSFTGLKYGLGESVGVWKAIDSVTGSDELPRR